MNDKPSKFNTLPVGIISGIALPVIFYFILYHSKLQDVQTTIFSHNMIIGNIIPLIVSHCILPNLVLFFVFNGFDWLKAAKGVVITTVIFTVALFAVKLIFSVL